MLMRAHVLVVLVLLGAGVGLPTGAAAAGPGDPVVTPGAGGKSNQIITVITDPGAPGGSSTDGVPGKKTSGGGKKTSGKKNSGAASPPAVGFEDGSYSLGGCYIEPQFVDPQCDAGPVPANTGPVIPPAPGSPPPPPVQVTPAQLAQQAVGELQLPDPQVDLSPSPDIVAYQLVNLPTWWVVENWAPRTQRTQLGPVFAEVTATPVSTRFDGGDGSAPVTCNRAGVKWRSGLPEELPQACRFTYQRSNEQVTATISMTWRVTWVGSGGTGGTLPPLTTSSDQPLTVYERQAVVTYGRG